jgi:hypothetical protein
MSKPNTVITIPAKVSAAVSSVSALSTKIAEETSKKIDSMLKGAPDEILNNSFVRKKLTEFLSGSKVLPRPNTTKYAIRLKTTPNTDNNKIIELYLMIDYDTGDWKQVMCQQTKTDQTQTKISISSGEYRLITTEQPSALTALATIATTPSTQQTDQFTTFGARLIQTEEQRAAFARHLVKAQQQKESAATQPSTVSAPQLPIAPFVQYHGSAQKQKESAATQSSTVSASQLPIAPFAQYHESAQKQKESIAPVIQSSIVPLSNQSSPVSVRSNASSESRKRKIDDVDEAFKRLQQTESFLDDRTKEFEHHLNLVKRRRDACNQIAHTLNDLLEISPSVAESHIRTINTFVTTCFDLKNESSLALQKDIDELIQKTKDDM